MKKMICLLLVVFLFASEVLPTYANAEITEETDTKLMNVFSEEDVNLLMTVPVYITSFNESESLSEVEKDNVSKWIEQSLDYSLINAIRTEGDGSEETLIKATNSCNIYKLADLQKRDLLQSSTYSSAFSRLHELLSKGVTINYINIFLVDVHNEDNEISLMSTDNSRSNADSIEYWESHYPLLGTYNGYKFLYSEVAANVETNWASLDNLDSSYTWKMIAARAVYMLLPQICGTQMSVLQSFQSALNSLFNGASPLSVSYSQSSGYLKGKVSGDLYIRSVYIRDDLDKVNGYAYYGWGSTERFAFVPKMDVKYPVSRNVSGTYEYDYNTKSYTKREKKTSGYSGNSAFYEKIIARYRGNGFTTYDENLDVYSISWNILESLQ